jgi:hypothetical protein
MKTPEQLKYWMENVPKSEKAKMMFQIKKRESLDNEEIKKKIRFADVDEDNIDEAIDLLIETFPDAGFDRDEIKKAGLSNNKLIENNINIEPSYKAIEPKKKSMFKEIVLSFLYLIAAFIITSLIYAFIAWFLDSVIINLLTWFNDLNLWLKIFLLFAGITTILSLLFNIVITINALICGLINMLFPVNIFTIIVSYLFAIINSVALTIELWNIVQSWNFWTAIEFLMIASFIVSMNFMFVPTRTKYGENY